jgi:hypothetical protein
MTAHSSLFEAQQDRPRRARLVRDPLPSTDLPSAEHFALQAGEMYRIAYAVGGTAQRRVTRSVVIYGGQSERRLWDGETVPCLDFTLPQGRSLSLLSNQLVDARPAAMNERGQWVLQQTEGRRRRAARRQSRY